MMWEVVTYGGGQYLNEVFKAVQLFFGGPFQSLAQVAGLIGLIAVLMAYLGPKQQLDVVYILRFAVFYGALFVPKADVAVVDRIEGGAPYVVADVPLGVAALAGMTSAIGDKLTTLYEGFMSTPNDQKYHKNGMVFGATLLKSVPQVRFTDATMAGDMQEFISQCGFSALASGAVTVEDLEKSEDVWALLRDHAPNNRFVMQSWSGGAVSCEDAATHPVYGLNARMPGQIEAAEKLIGKLIWNKMTPEDARIQLMSVLPATASDLAGISRSSSEIMRQAMTINAISAALDKLPPDEAAGAMASIQAKTAAERSRFETYMTMGSVVARSVPITRLVLEALAYALFPVVALMILLPSGLMALFNYFIVLFWLQMWPVIYAVLNSVVYWYSTHANKAGALMPSGLTDWTMWTTPALVSTNSEIVAMAGYLAISVPIIAYMLVRGGAVIGSQVATALMQPAQGAATQAGREVAYGNFQSGSVTLDTVTAHNSTMWQSRTGYSSTYGVNVDGSSSYRLGHTETNGPFTRISTADGSAVAHRKMDSEYGVAPKITEQLLGTFRTEAGKQWAAALDQANQYTDLTSNALARSLGVNWSKIKSAESSSGTGFERGTEVGKIGADVKEKLDRWERDSGFSMEDKARLLFGVGGDLPLHTIASPLIGIAMKLYKSGKFAGAKESDMQAWEKSLTDEVNAWKKKNNGDPEALKGKNGSGFNHMVQILEKLAMFRYGVEGSIHAGMAQILKSAQAYSEQNNLRDQFSEYERAVREALKHTDTTTLRTTGAEEVKNLFERAHETREQYEAALRKTSQFSETASRIETSGAAFDLNLMPRFDRFLEGRGIHDPARFAHDSIQSGDGRVESLIREFVKNEAESIVNSVTRSAPVRPGEDREGAARNAYDDYKEIAASLGAPSPDLSKQEKALRGVVMQQGVNPDEAKRGTPGARIGASAINRKVTDTGVKAGQGLTGIEQNTDDRGSTLRPAVEEKVPKPGQGSNVRGMAGEAFDHLTTRGRDAQPPENSGPPKQPPSFRPPPSPRPHAGADGGTSSREPAQTAKPQQDGLWGEALDNIGRAIRRTGEQLMGGAGDPRKPGSRE